ncbi:hypothetical protein ACU5DF_11075 [Aliivibrio wodanis]|uniref:hypothetical protein n=1 Tax=Aliivibrio wodanis TaxID=80852 RepID=UPI00406C8698
MAEKAAIMGDEDKQYKLQMAELTRTLGRVRLDENELPKEIRENPISIFQFEKELTDYLYIQGLANEEQALPAAESVHYEPVYTPQAKAKLQELKNTYSYEPDSKLLKKFKETTAYTSDVNWEGLDEFVISHYSQLKGTSERINNYLSDFIAAVTQLGIDPLILGLDNQYENHQAYLLNIVSQFLIVVKQVPELEEQMKELDELLSLDSPNNLLALAPWMLSALMVSGVIYLISIIIINIFTRTELQNWLYESCWGKGDLQWGNIEAISRLESILYKPQLSLKKIIGRKPTHSQDPGSMQWQLIVDLPSFTENKYIELKVKRIPYTPTFRYGFKQPEKLKPILVDEQGGQWVRTVNNSPRYVITIGGTVKDDVEVELKMPSNGSKNDIEYESHYLASGKKEGSLVIKSLSNKTIKGESLRGVLLVGEENNA